VLGQPLRGQPVAVDIRPKHAAATPGSAFHEPFQFVDILAFGITRDYGEARGDQVLDDLVGTAEGMVFGEHAGGAGPRSCFHKFAAFVHTDGGCDFAKNMETAKTLRARTARFGPLHSLHSLWARRFATEFGGGGYITQRGAEAVYSKDGKAQVRALVDHYLENARLLSSALRGADLEVFGGTNAPFLWVSTPRGMSSWDFFDHALRELNIIVTSGSGFGSAGEGWFRVSAFNTRLRAEEAARRFATLSR